MNILQMHYFITAARLLNFSKAAEKLYVSQPALSKQISAIEKELGFKLFERAPNSVRLTPSGAALLRRLPTLLEDYYNIISSAKYAQAGHLATLTVGYLEGQHLSEHSAKIFHRFIEEQPQFAVKLVYDSFQGLRERLEAGELDIALSLDFDMREKGDIRGTCLETCRPYLVISRSFDICWPFPI